MAYIKMTNYAGQILKGMNISAPPGAVVYDALTNNPIHIRIKTHYKVIGNNRMGIGRYKINLQDSTNKQCYSMNYMMDDEDKPGHAIWSLEDAPYTPEMIHQLYGYKVGPDGQRAKKYKLSGRVRTRKIAKELRDLGRHEDADRILKEMEETVAQGKRYLIYRSDLGL